MNVEQEEMVDLAYGFVQGSLSAEERRQAQKLVLESPEFLQVLRLELALKDKVEALKVPLPDSVKLRVYNSITSQSHELLCKKMLQSVLTATLPTITRPMLGLLERSVFANEQL